MNYVQFTAQDKDGTVYVRTWAVRKDFYEKLGALVESVYGKPLAEGITDSSTAEAIHEAAKPVMWTHQEGTSA